MNDRTTVEVSTDNGRTWQQHDVRSTAPVIAMLRSSDPWTDDATGTQYRSVKAAG